MKKQSIKKTLCVLATSVCLLSSSVPVYAIDFDVTPPDDPYSYETKKEDSEQNFYITGTYFGASGNLHCYSQNTSNHNIKSYAATINKKSPRAIQKYRTWADPYEYYELYTWSNITGMNVLGRYNP